MRSLSTLSFALGLLIVQACSDAEASPEDAASAKTQDGSTGGTHVLAKAYPTETVTVTDVSTPIAITGRIVPLQEATISSQVPGLVLPSKRIAQEGSFYRKGEVMFAINNEPLVMSLKAARAEFASAIVRLLPALQNDYRYAFPRYKAFVDAIDPSRTLPELPKATTDTLRYFLGAAGIDGQYFRIKAQEATLDDYVVRAPFTGRLTSANLQPGAVVQPGQPLATLQRNDVYEVRAAVPAAAAVRLKAGQKIAMRAPSIDRTYRGTVDRLSSQIEDGSQSVTAFIRVSGEELRTGLFLEADLPGQTLRQVAALPKEVLTRDGNVYVIRDSTVRLQAVEVAALQADKVYLRGLTTGERVITSGVQGTAVVGTRAQ